MIKKQQNIINKFSTIIFLISIIVIWQFLVYFKIFDEFLLPYPTSVIKALIRDSNILIEYAKITLTEAFLGLFISIVLAYIFSFLMDRFKTIKTILYPTLTLSQTIPVIAIAPLLVLWLGYGMEPKIALVVLTCFFPLTVGLYDGIEQIDKDYINEFKVLGGSYLEGVIHIKIPLSLPSFFSGLKIAVSYAVVGAVISEWVGGTVGLGVYMTRVRKAYAFDKMFAVILIISVISVALISLVKLIEKKVIIDVI